MKQVIINTILIFIVSILLVWGLSFASSLDTTIIIIFLLISLLHTSLIIALLIKKK
ncbi:hypothetical protein MXL46_13625 [Heyndrickxia sporothermodurans]|uniref:NADH dehydrogenase subunit 4L n=1 Tax=Heyndrickxia sporothermodurans TaxID=46224 RepID=A0AB37HL26_9BACI|nr:hypothetical protein [Heyndrickxia sporothermodurans]MBL5772521.1 hypothetical protein [Heyndrickxia sporothermodurans]MBL5874808.1 hypothetical protein [Heyndrickxia sporothermodurans]MEB6550129.1 hypothetical protein [Heyndrickxia sporothermodurans]MED3652914.1 hypothetical protein [Heyndrickxia sporothermodurans]QQX26057.1 hypothetical protein JGZ69_03715 [Heyndrickxia sporothermodurans]